MRKIVLCLFYAVCAFTIAFSLFWMALPRLPLPDGQSPDREETDFSPSLAAQALPDTSVPPLYLLCDEGGKAVVYRCGPDGSPAQRLEETEIYVNLLPESDALKLKQGLSITGEAALRQTLEDLGG